MKKEKTKKLRKRKLEKALDRSFINYFSDLFIVAMVVLWIVNNLYQTVIATIVTLSSIQLSMEVGYDCFNVSMWADIGSNIAIPLSCGGALWMLKCGVQHAIANHKGKQAKMDFPRVDVEDLDCEEPIDNESAECGESEEFG